MHKPILSFTSQEAWRRWLDKHHAMRSGNRLQDTKKPKTRERWVQRILAMLAGGKAFHSRRKIPAS